MAPCFIILSERLDITNDLWIEGKHVNHFAMAAPEENINSQTNLLSCRSQEESTFSI